MRKLFYFLLLITYTSTNNPPIAWAQQSAAGQDTLIGVVGTDYVMIGADSSSSGGGGISLTSSNIDKIAVVHDGSGGKRFGKRSFFSESDGVGGSDWYDCLSRESLEQQAIVVAFAGDAADGKLPKDLTIKLWQYMFLCKLLNWSDELTTNKTIFFTNPSILFIFWFLHS